jgi:hypothetical protein
MKHPDVGWIRNVRFLLNRVRERTNTDLALPFSLAAVPALPCIPPLPPHFICILASTSFTGFISSHSRAVIGIEGREVCSACRLKEQATGFTRHPYSLFP